MTIATGEQIIAMQQFAEFEASEEAFCMENAVAAWLS